MTNSTIDLDKLERLEREATPGPWHWKHNDIVQRDEAGKFVADVAGMYYDLDGYPNWGADNAANTELIIALRNAAPALFSELRAARERIAELEEHISSLECIAKAKGAAVVESKSAEELALVGNSVCPHVARALVHAQVNAGERREAA